MRVAARVDVRTPATVHAVGIDLAWGDNPSGIAHLIGTAPGAGAPAWRLAETTSRRSIDAITEWVRARIPTTSPAWIAVDAPLAAMNAPGTMRPCEHDFRRDFLRFRVSVYPTDPTKAARGIALRQALEQQAFIHTVPHPTGETARGVFETFPTAAQLSLFELRRPIRYKRGDTTARRDGLRRLQLALAGLDDAALPLAGSSALSELLRTDPAGLGGVALKDLEDRLDALLAALVAALAWRAPARLAVYGTPDAGAIIVPHAPAHA